MTRQMARADSYFFSFVFSTKGESNDEKKRVKRKTGKKEKGLTSFSYKNIFQANYPCDTRKMCPRHFQLSFRFISARFIDTYNDETTNGKLKSF